MTSSSCCSDSKTQKIPTVLMYVTFRLLLGHIATDASVILASGGIVPIIHLMGRLDVCCYLDSDFECPICRLKGGGGHCLGYVLGVVRL